MDYKECSVHIYEGSTGQELDAKRLFQLANDSRVPLFLLFRQNAQSDANQIGLEFRKNWDLFGVAPSNATSLQNCHYQAVHHQTHERSVMSVCDDRDINGLIRINGRQFVLGSSSENNNFHFYVEKWPKHRRKRSPTGKEPIFTKVPEYYAEYIDGVKRWVELVFIADSTIFKKYEENEKRVHDRLHSIASAVNALYAPLNIRITLVWADVWKSANPIEVSEDADKTLRDFLNYRKALLEEHPHDNAHLLTDVHFGSVIGKGTMCSYDYSGGVIVDHAENPVFVGMTVAHEMGHNFGMDHDIGQCNCPVDVCIMAPASSNINATSYFSDCSLDTLSSGLRRGVDYCLHNVPKIAFGGAKCGNGILEDGEDCDCGSTTSCPNKCCIPSQCKLAKEAECADGDCCDLGVCKLKPMASVCRQSVNGCDLPEFCDGKNPSCPADFFVQDGHKCPDAPEDFCYQGVCGSRTQQCKFIWGPSAENSAPECYAYNEYGSFSGNCGYNQTNDQYLRCKPSDVTCGRLQCVHDSDKPVFGDPSTVYSAYNYVKTRDGRDETCRVVRTTLTGTGKRKPDPGMVPDGAKCGNNKICVNASCKNKTEVLQMLSKCDPEDCNHKGICNNVGNCHCVNGYGGVSCDLPGYGGSVNSGPANDSVFNPGMALLYFFLFASALFLAASIYCKWKKKFWIHKVIWSKFRKALELRTFKFVPTRRAPPPPGAPIRHTHRQSWNAVWDDPDPPAQGEILQVDASRPYALGGARAFVRQQIKLSEKPQKSPEWAQSGVAGMDKGHGKNDAAAVSYAISKPAEEKKKPNWIGKAAEEQRALVHGYDTGKSSSSDDSERHPPPIPPHGNISSRELVAAGRAKPQPPKKPTTKAKAIQADGEATIGAVPGDNSKINVKALAARFEKH